MLLLSGRKACVATEGLIGGLGFAQGLIGSSFGGLGLAQLSLDILLGLLGSNQIRLRLLYSELRLSERTCRTTLKIRDGLLGLLNGLGKSGFGLGLSSFRLSDFSPGQCVIHLSLLIHDVRLIGLRLLIIGMRLGGRCRAAGLLNLLFEGRHN